MRRGLRGSAGRRGASGCVRAGCGRAGRKRARVRPGAHAHGRAAQGADPVRHRGADRGIEAGRGARASFRDTAKAVLQRRRRGEGGRAAVRDRSRAVRNRAGAGEGSARAGDRAGRPGAARGGPIAAAGAGSRGQPQGIRRRDLRATARRSVDSTGQRLDSAGRAQSFVYARDRAADRHQRARRAFDRHADHDRRQRQPADDDQPADAGMGALQPRPGGPGQPARRPPRSLSPRRHRAAASRTAPPTRSRAGSTSRPPRSIRGWARSNCAPNSTIRASSFCPGSSSPSGSPPASATRCSWCRRRPSSRPRKAISCSSSTPQGKAQARPVKTGDWIGKDWTILSGLNAGDKVVIDNLLKVQPGVALTEAPPVETAAVPAAASNAPAGSGSK